MVPKICFILLIDGTLNSSQKYSYLNLFLQLQVQLKISIWIQVVLEDNDNMGQQKFPCEDIIS